MAADHTAALAWLPADGSWRAEPESEPELSQTVDMLTALANDCNACEPAWREGKWQWRLTEPRLAIRKSMNASPKEERIYAGSSKHMPHKRYPAHRRPLIGKGRVGE